jgi:ankyrin repeat protein
MLMHAAWSNQIDLMRNLLDRGVDPNAAGVWSKARGNTMTPLQAAVVDGQFDAARLLVERGAKVRESKDEKMSEMETAIYNRRKAIIQVLWEHGFRGISPLAYAISQGQPADEIEKLLEAGASPEPPEDKHITPLGLAARQGDLRTVRLLVDRHAGVNSGSDKCRPLALAAAEGQDEIVTYLLEHGAKIDFEGMWQTVWNCNPYPDQREKEHFETTIKTLIDAGFLQGIGERETARLFSAAVFSRNPRGNPAVVRMLVEAGLDSNARDESGKTILEQARAQCTQETCQTPTKEMVALLEELKKNKRAVK